MIADTSIPVYKAKTCSGTYNGNTKHKTRTWSSIYFDINVYKQWNKCCHLQVVYFKYKLNRSVSDENEWLGK